MPFVDTDPRGLLTVTRILIAPGSMDGSPAWYRWLADQLKVDPDIPDDVEIEVVTGYSVCPMVMEQCIPVLGAALDAGETQTTLLVGHSTSCLAWIHTLAMDGLRMPPYGLICIGGFFEVDSPYDWLEPWLDAKFDWPLDIMRASKPIPCCRVHAVISDNDEHTTDHQRNLELWLDNIDARITIVKGANHFNASEAPEVLQKVKELYTESTHWYSEVLDFKDYKEHWMGGVLKGWKPGRPPAHLLQDDGGAGQPQGSQQPRA
jgi:predicted alpha/beta hydrolase family esterase